MRIFCYMCSDRHNVIVFCCLCNCVTAMPRDSICAHSDIAQKSTQLTMESKRYAAQAKHANRMRVIRQYAPGVVVLVVVILLWALSRYFGR